MRKGRRKVGRVEVSGGHFLRRLWAVWVVATAVHAAGAGDGSGPAWIQAGLNTNRPVWGIAGSLVWGLPAGRDVSDGPRGLIRLWYPTLPGGGYDLINFIAVEPVVRGQKGFSELERSALDGMAGKRLWALDSATTEGNPTHHVPGELSRSDSRGDALRVRIGVERFENGAEVELTVIQRRSNPDEIELEVRATAASAPLDYGILTATMGNKARARRLWLKDRIALSRELYPDYHDAHFAPHRFFALDRLHRTAAGDILVAITTDEADPASVDPAPAAGHWRYRGVPVTQYWRKPAGSWGEDLQVAVNGRYTYWMSSHAIPGGIAFENFELRERFVPEQRFVFGITRRTPEQLGFR